MAVIRNLGIILLVIILEINYCSSQNFDVLQEEDATYSLYTFHTTMRKYFSMPVDIVFLLDESGSVGLSNYQHEIKFTELIARFFVLSPNTARAALISFDDYAKLKFDFITSGNGDMCNFLSNLALIGYGAGWTNTASGLEEAGRVLRQGRSNSKKILVLLSDGESNTGGDPAPIASNLRKMGIIIFCVGIANAKESELLGIASSPSHLYLIKDFNYIVRVNERLRGDIINKIFTKQPSNVCDSICTRRSNCCDKNADCFCGSDGVFSCQCRAGYMGLGHEGACTKCPKGQYNPDVGRGECIFCPVNSATDFEGATSISECKCNPGFSGNPADGTLCKSRECPKLFAPIGGRLVPANCGNKVDDECNFLCEPPYCPYNGFSPNCIREESRKVQKSRKCLSNGQWSGPQFFCEEASCDPLEDPKNGVYRCDSTNTRIGTRCSLECNLGYGAVVKNIKVSNRVWTCLESGTWDTPANVKCRPVGCQPLKTNALLHVKPQTCGTAPQQFQTKCQYFCSPGYKLILSNVEGDVLAKGSRICEAKGWKDRTEKVKCKDGIHPNITCPEDITVSNAPLQKVSRDVVWKLPLATDNDGYKPVVKLVEPKYQKGGLLQEHLQKLRSKFPIGKNKLVYQAKDRSGLTAKCSFYVIVNDNEPPMVQSCPQDIKEFTTSKDPYKVTWDSPQFRDNSGKIHLLLQTHKSGDLFKVNNRHEVVFTALDEYNNEQSCRFYVIPRTYRCDYRRQPRNGFVTCQSISRVIEECSIECNVNYAFATNDPKTYRCEVSGGVGDWAPDTPWPDCSKTSAPTVTTPKIKLQSSNIDCDDPESYKKLMNQVIKSFCANRDPCDVSNVKITCAPADLNPRVKRDTGHSSITIEFDTKPDLNTQNTSTSEEDLQAEFNKFLQTKLQEFADENDKEITITITSDPVLSCGPGKVLKGKLCVNCPIGTYQDGKICKRCLLNMYQDEESSTQCKPCPSSKFTLTRGSINITDCRGACGPGNYSKTGLEQCTACPIGTYQHNYQQKACTPCPQGKTTWEIGAKSESQCTVQCAPGSVSSTGYEPCDLCPIGSYQSKYGQTKCIACNGTLLTEQEGTTDASLCVDIDVCNPNPCLNNGSCTLGDDYQYRCECIEGIVGPRCEINIDDCAPHLCYNNGTCIDGIDDFTCECQTGFSGNQCTENIDDCYEGACWNGGTCVDGINSFTCVCEKGFAGTVCEIGMDDCKSNPCKNGGTCQDLVQGYQCCCPKGYFGNSCEIKENDCNLDNPCLHGSTCILSSSGFICVCPKGYKGIKCETNIDDCVLNPCQNSGTCIDLINEYSCKCINGFEGRNCEIAMSADFEAHFSAARTSNYALIETKQDLFAITVAFWMKVVQQPNLRGTPVSFSYKSRENDTVYANALTWYDTNKFIIYIHNQEIRTTIEASADVNWHHYALTWDSFDGSYVVYKDGSVMVQGSKIGVGVPLWRGFFVLGQEQDILAGGFSSTESFVGYLTEFNVWNYPMSVNEIKIISQACNYLGNVVTWTNLKEKFHGDDVSVSTSELCTSQIKKCGQTEKECYCQTNGLHDEKVCEKKFYSCSAPNCHHNQRCVVTSNTSAFCDCQKGFAGNLCQYDVNECLENNGNCSHECVNTVGSFKCNCPVDYSLSDDGFNCISTKQCQYNSRIYVDNETWVEECKECVCLTGKVTCALQNCPDVKCPTSDNPVTFPGKCCPECVAPNIKRCVIKPNNLYTSFDNKNYKLTSSCRYILAHDCSNASITIEVQNSMISPEKKTLTIKTNCNTFEITTGGNLLVNGIIETIPYVSSEFIRVEYIVGQQTKKNRANIIATVYNGMSILWTHFGRVEVRAASNMQKKMCGLCGNFNDKKNDDWMTKNYHVANSLSEFVLNWRVNHSEDCQAPQYAVAGLPQKRRLGSCNQSTDKWKYAQGVCEGIREYPFYDCYKNVNPQTFYDLCVQDACSCRIKPCHCDAISAFVDECKKYGLIIQTWKGKDICDNRCQNGTVFNACGPLCLPTCSGTEKRNPNCLNTKLCRPGCHCPPGMVFHQNTCISPKHCPSL